MDFYFFLALKNKYCFARGQRNPSNVVPKSWCKPEIGIFVKSVLMELVR